MDEATEEEPCTHRPLDAKCRIAASRIGANCESAVRRYVGTRVAETAATASDVARKMSGIRLKPSCPDISSSSRRRGTTVYLHIHTQGLIIARLRMMRPLFGSTKGRSRTKFPNLALASRNQLFAWVMPGVYSLELACKQKSGLNRTGL